MMNVNWEVDEICFIYPNLFEMLWTLSNATVSKLSCSEEYYFCETCCKSSLAWESWCNSVHNQQMMANQAIGNLRICNATAEIVQLWAPNRAKWPISCFLNEKLCISECLGSKYFLDFKDEWSKVPLRLWNCDLNLWSINGSIQKCSIVFDCITVDLKCIFDTCCIGYLCEIFNFNSKTRLVYKLRGRGFLSWMH